MRRRPSCLIPILISFVKLWFVHHVDGGFDPGLQGFDASLRNVGRAIAIPAIRGAFGECARVDKIQKGAVLAAIRFGIATAPIGVIFRMTGQRAINAGVIDRVY